MVGYVPTMVVTGDGDIKVAAFKKLVVVSQFMSIGQSLNSDYFLTEH